QRSGGTPAFRFAFAVLVVIPKGIRFLSFRSFRKPPLSGCPIHRAICDGWDCKNSTSLNNIVAPAFTPGAPLPYHPEAVIPRASFPRHVISTEAAHGLIVSSAVEKSTSPP